MKRKLLPPFIMLLAGAVTSIAMYLNHYEIKVMLWILVAVLVFFYIIGLVIKNVMDSFEKTNENLKNNNDEGIVIKKESIEENAEEEQNEAKQS